MSAFVRFGLGFLLVFAALFLIALVLIQRGRGGGLAGAFGGMGGQSAFGTKAGDVFTRITVIAATCWILLCILAINMLGRSKSLFSPSLGGSAGQAVPSRTPAADAMPQTPPAADATTALPAAASASGSLEQPAVTTPPAAPTEPAEQPPAAAAPPAATEPPPAGDAPPQ
ncbi:MAG: preprotein translocase subunit SecG [Planctomycetes bacterium]|nr:preprotein translocase subunit SecG [Planctomycetota bacterium]MBM4057897.1 preprotein translocase subunit SecG [Planctomycetota bacterium]